MKQTLEDLLKWKKQRVNLGINAYEWFFNELENNHISKLSGVKRNAALIEKYDEEAQAYIIHQLYYYNEEAASELLNEIGMEKPFVSDENYQHINKPN